MGKSKHCISFIGILIIVLAIWDMVSPLKWASIGFLILGILLIAHEASSCCSPKVAPLAVKPTLKPAKKPLKKLLKPKKGKK